MIFDDPAGISNYGDIIRKGLPCIDKAKFIEKLESYAFYASVFRRWQFGKTLFTSVLEHYCDCRCKDDFVSFVWQNMHDLTILPLMNAYLILMFDFSGLPGKNICAARV
jgi:hypothetical protein